MAKVNNSKVTELKNLGILDQFLKITSGYIKINTIGETFNKVRISNFLDIEFYIIGKSSNLFVLNHLSDAIF